MEKIIALLMIIIMLFSLSACKEDNKYEKYEKLISYIEDGNLKFAHDEVDKIISENVKNDASDDNRDDSSYTDIDNMTLQEKIDNGLLNKYELIGGYNILENVVDVYFPTANDQEGLLEDQEDLLELITKDGSLYQLSIGKKFSNGTNFRKIDRVNKFVRFYGRYIVDDECNAYQWATETTLEPANFDIPSYFAAAYGMYNLDITKVIKIRGTTSYNLFGQDSYEIFAENNKLYRGDEILYTFDENIKIEYATNDGNTIKTTDGWYIITSECTNQEDVDNFVDIEPQYQMKIVKVDLDPSTTFYCDHRLDDGKDGFVIQNGILYVYVDWGI